MERKIFYVVKVVNRRIWLAALAFLFVACLMNCRAQSQSSGPADEIRIVEIQGAVEVFPKGASGWSAAKTTQFLQAFERLRAGENSRVVFRCSDESGVSFGAS